MLFSVIKVKEFVIKCNSVAFCKILEFAFFLRSECITTLSRDVICQKQEIFLPAFLLLKSRIQAVSFIYCLPTSFMLILTNVHFHFVKHLRSENPKNRIFQVRGRFSAQHPTCCGSFSCTRHNIGDASGKAGAGTGSLRPAAGVLRFRESRKSGRKRIPCRG